MVMVRMLTIDDSSVIQKVGYEPTTNMLFVEFKSGSTYVYDKVPESRFIGMISAPSAGHYFSKNIKNDFNFTKL